MNFANFGHLKNGLVNYKSLILFNDMFDNPLNVLPGTQHGLHIQYAIQVTAVAVECHHEEVDYCQFRPRSSDSPIVEDLQWRWR